MRTLWIAIAAGATGCLVGLGLTGYEFARVGDYFDGSYVGENTGSADEEAIIAGRAVVLGEQSFDFGTLERNQTGTCKFKIRNESPANLEVQLEGVSCGLCIRTDLAHMGVHEGEEFEFSVDYTTHKPGPEFAEYVEMRTSDPDNSVIRFDITGYVTQSIRFSQDTILLGSMSAEEDVSADFRIYGYTDEPIEMLAHEFTSDTFAGFFELETTPLKLEDFKEEEPRAKSAIQAKLTMTRGKPLGPIKQTLRVTARTGDTTTSADVTITGTIVSDIVLIGGKEFIKDKNLLRLRNISSEIGHTSTLRVRVRGPFRDDVKLSLGEVTPDTLKATLGEPTKVGNGYLFPLVITIPKGSASINRLGSQQGKVGVVNIETTHPTAKKLPVYVSFAVE